MDIKQYISDHILYNEKAGINKKSSIDHIFKTYQSHYANDWVELPLPINENYHLHINLKLLEPLVKNFINVADQIEHIRTKEEKINSSFIHEIYNNLLIENHSSSRRMIEDIVCKKTHISDKVDYVVQNTFNAMQFVMQKRPINKDNLRTLYLLMTTDIDMGNQKLDGSYYRQDKVYVAQDEGVDPSLIDQYMEALFKYIDDSDDLSHDEKIVKLIIIHFYFEFIHPYYDFNGRTGRILVIWVAHNWGIYDEFAFFSTSLANYREQYLKLFKQATFNQVIDITHFVANILQITIKQKEHYQVVTKICEYVNKTFNKKLNPIQRDILMIDQANRDIYNMSNDAEQGIENILKLFPEYADKYIYKLINELESYGILIKLSKRNIGYRINYDIYKK